MNIAICDDEFECVEEIEKCLDRLKKKHKNINWDAFYSAEELLDYYKINPKEFDILITDIQMKTINGIELANLIRSQDNEIIIYFLSSHDEYIRQCFEPSPANFWDKPIQYEQFEFDLEKAFMRIKKSNKVFVIKEQGKSLRLSYSDIICFISSGKKIIVQTTKQNYEFYGSCSEFEKQWNGNGFIRINRGCYINSVYIYSLRGQEIVLRNGSQYIVSRANIKNVKLLFSETDYRDAMEEINNMGKEI